MKEISSRQWYVLVAATIMIMGGVVFCYITPNKKIELAATQIELIAENIHRHFSSKVNYWGLSTKYVVDNNILTNWSYDNAQLVNALGKNIEIGQNENGDAVMPGDRSFVIAYRHLSMKECIALAAYRFERPEELGLLSITIKNKDHNQSFDWGEGDYKIPIRRQETKKFCRNNSTVIWTIE